VDSKSCRKCRTEKPLTEFYVRKSAKDGRYNICSECDRAEAQVRKRLLTPEKRKRYARTYVVGAYSLTLEDYDDKVTRQNGVCAICRKPPVRDRHLAVDHDRRCCPGKTSCGNCVRDLLCIKCNTALGMIGDSMDIAMSIHNYILEHNLQYFTQ